MSTTTLDLSRVDTIVTEDPDRPLTPIPLGLVEQELATMKLTIALQTTKALNQLRAFLLNVASGGVRRVTMVSRTQTSRPPHERWTSKGTWSNARRSSGHSSK